MIIIYIWLVSIVMGIIFAKLIQLMNPEFVITQTDARNWDLNDTKSLGNLCLFLCVFAPIVSIILLINLLIISSGKFFKWLLSPKIIEVNIYDKE